MSIYQIKIRIKSDWKIFLQGDQERRLQGIKNKPAAVDKLIELTELT